MTWTNEDQRTLEGGRAFLLGLLRKTAQHRGERSEITDAHEPAWVAYERGVMLDATNRLRAERGLGPVELADVARVEQLACGHIDYASKYALYCAELVCGITPRELAAER